MSSSFVIARNYGQNTAPGRRPVKLAAGVNAEIGAMLVQVAGYGAIPAAANFNTGHMAGIVVDPADNTSGGAGDATAVVDVFTANFANSGTSPCSQANVGQIVYAASATVISTLNTDGPPAGKLISYNANDVQGRPCEVALDCMV